MKTEQLLAIGGGLGLLLWFARARAASGMSSSSPGYETSDLGALAPAMRSHWGMLRNELAAEGFDVEVLRTYRDSVRQKHYFDNKWSQVTRSYHTVTRGGRPASYALDVSLRGRSWSNPLDIPILARFYLRLRALAGPHGLRTGGDYRQTNTTWAAYGLGWDPGHIEPSGTSIAAVHSGSDPWT